MSLLLVLALCQTLSAGQATEATQATEAGDYEQLFHLFMEIAGKGDNIYSKQEYIQDQGLFLPFTEYLPKITIPKITLPDFEDIYNKAKTVAKTVFKVFKATNPGLNALNVKTLFRLYEDINTAVSYAAPYVAVAVNNIADHLSNKVRQTREDITGAYAAVSGVIKDSVHIYTAIGGKKIDELHEIGLGITKDLKQYNIGFDSTLEEVLNVSAVASKNALQAANFSVVLGERVFFVAFNTTLFMIEEVIQEDIEKFRNKTFEFMFFHVGLPLLLGLLFAAGPITVPLVIGLLAQSFLSAWIVTFIKKLIDLYFVKVIAKRSPNVHDTVQCFFSTRVGMLILLVLETYLAMLVGDKVGDTLTPTSTNAEIAVFKTKVQSSSFIETVIDDVESLKGALSLVIDYLTGLVQLWLFPEDDADYYTEPNDCFARLKNLTFEDVFRAQMSITVPRDQAKILSGEVSE